MFGIPFQGEVAQSRPGGGVSAAAVKRGDPQSSSSARGARLCTCQRVAAALGSGAAPSRSRNKRDAAFLRQQRQPAAGHQVEAALGVPEISSTTAPTCGQARMSAAADRASAALAVRSRNRFSGSPPSSSKPGGRQGAIFQRLIIRPDPEKRLLAGLPSPGWQGRRRSRSPPSRRANTSCRAPGLRPPPSTASAPASPRESRAGHGAGHSAPGNGAIPPVFHFCSCYVPDYARHPPESSAAIACAPVMLRCN